MRFIPYLCNNEKFPYSKFSLTGNSEALQYMRFFDIIALWSTFAPVFHMSYQYLISAPIYARLIFNIGSFSDKKERE